MASNIIIAGNTYPSVPSILVPKVGGGYAEYSEGGGGDEDVVVFDVVWDENWETILSVTCNKTYSECLAKYDNDHYYSAICKSYTQGSSVVEGVDGLNVVIVNSTPEYIKYSLTSSVNFGWDIYYYSDGSITTTVPTDTVRDLNVTANGEYYCDDYLYGYVNVNVPQPTLQTKTKTYTPYTSPQREYITADSGYGGLSQVTVTVSAMPSGSVSNPTATKGTVSNHSVSVTPSVTSTTGYITGGTKTGTAVTVSASELVSGSETKTANGTYDVTNLAQLIVNVPSGGSGLTLLQTTSLGQLSTSSTTANSTGKTISLASSTGFNDYDLLIVDISVDTITNGRHTSTVSMVLLTGTSNVNQKNTFNVVGSKWNSKLSDDGIGSTRQITSASGIYVYSPTVSDNTLKMSVYYRYNSTHSGTINGTYTARVYGVKLYDLIGG